MKLLALKYVFSIFAILLSLPANGAPPSYVTIPDANFRAALKALYPGCFNASDQMDITCTSVTGATSLDVSGKSISNLTGISYFAGLTSLDCHNNQLSSLPPLPLLTFLNYSSNFLTTSPPLPSTLTHLDCANNLLSTLPSPLPSGLTYLDFHSNQFIGLPAPPLPSSLTYLDCSNNKLTTLLTLPATLATLLCQNNQFDFADLEGINPKPATYQASPQINNSLLDKTAAFASTLSLDGTIGGSSNQYQWYKNSVIIPGATSAVFNKANLDFTDAGTYQCQVTSSLSSNSGITISSRIAAITVIKANQNIVFGALPAKTFGNSAFTISASASSGLPISYMSSDATVATVSGNIVTIVGAGYCTIWASQAGNSGYNPAINVGQGLTIYRANQTITFPGWPAKSYGDPSFLLAATATSGLPVSYRITDLNGNPDVTVATISGNTVTIIGAGSTWIRASQEGNSNYGNASEVSLRLDVSKASQTITFSALPTKTYGDPSYTITATASSGLPVTFISSNTSVATISGSTVTIVAAGVSAITASQGGNANYNAATSIPQTLTINKANQTITFSALLVKNYGDAGFTLSASVNSGLPINYVSSNTAVATIFGSVVTVVGAGTSTITASQAGSANYNAASSVDQLLTVNKINQAISFNSLTAKSYGDPAFTLSASASSGLAISYASSNATVATISGNIVTIVGGGTSTITTSQTGNANYNAATPVAQTLTVNKANQTITFASLPAKILGDAAFSLAATASSGLSVTYASSNTSVATIAGNTVTMVGAGSAVITASQVGNGNYNQATPIPQSLQVIQPPSIASFSPQEGPVGTTVVISGLGFSATQSNNIVKFNGVTATVTASTSTSITTSLPAGATYGPITVTVGGLTATSSTSFVVKTVPVISMTSPSTGTYGGTITLMLNTGGSAGGLSYTVTNGTGTATVSGIILSLTGAGTVTVTANLSAYANYTAASTTQTITINKANQAITFDPLPVRIQETLLLH